MAVSTGEMLVIEATHVKVVHMKKQQILAPFYVDCAIHVKCLPNMDG